MVFTVGRVVVVACDLRLAPAPSARLLVLAFPAASLALAASRMDRAERRRDSDVPEISSWGEIDLTLLMLYVDCVRREHGNRRSEYGKISQ
jgi:hypothetical protein